MAGRKAGKQKQQEIQNPKEKMAKPLRFGKMEFYVGARVEALENKHWYAAKVVKVNEKDRKVLIHFEGWNQRYDCWLPIHSPKLKATTKATPKDTSHEDPDRDYNNGDHVLARWANGRHYPAEIVKSVGEGNYEVLFFDGFRKIVSKANIKLDKKKMYKELEQKVDKRQRTPSVEAKPALEQATSSNADISGSSRHRKPVAMLDFVTALPRKNKRRSDTDADTGEKAASMDAAQMKSENNTKVVSKQANNQEDLAPKRPKRNAKKKF